MANITSKEWAADKHNRTNDERTFNETDHYEANFFSPEDHGTAHISVLAPNGDAVAVTTTINFYFGSEILSPSTGIGRIQSDLDFTSMYRNNSEQ